MEWLKCNINVSLITVAYINRDRSMQNNFTDGSSNTLAGHILVPMIYYFPREEILRSKLFTFCIGHGNSRLKIGL